MICPSCGANDDRVIDSRSSDGGRVIRRRRECLQCERRFTTYERVEQATRLMVVKTDGRRVPFESEKVLQSIAAACGKRPVGEDTKARIVEEIEEDLHRSFEREVPSDEIGRRVMDRLREVDDVAYLRFASEYHVFDLRELAQQAQRLVEAPKDVRDQQNLF
ncbi:MAG: transcriptional repressor NrdR [Phycisphaerales bacterium]|nr:transcriptional repressor NrdR [Phycisphaerales bacterium]